MDDIVERLRNHTEGNDMVTHEVVNDAADEIERLRAIITRQTAAQQSNKQ